MADRNINCTLISRHDSEENWVLAKDFIPRQGEIVIYDADQLHNYERVKVGDGKTVVGDLPFINSGLEVVDYFAELEEKEFTLNADFLGGVRSEEYALKKAVVTSVNGQVGDIVNLEIVDIEENLENGSVILNANQLGGLNADNYALKKEVVSSINNETGRVTIPKIKNLNLRFVYDLFKDRNCATVPDQINEIINIIPYGENIVVSNITLEGQEISLKGMTFVNVDINDTLGYILANIFNGFYAKVYYI